MTKEDSIDSVAYAHRLCAHKPVIQEELEMVTQASGLDKGGEATGTGFSLNL